MSTETKVTPYHKVRDFILEIQAEMLKVTWPSKEDLQVSTKVVVMLLVVMAALVYVADQVFAKLIYGLLILGSK